MILLLVLILPLSEEDNRLPKHVAKPEWTATISDDTPKQGSYARPPPSKRCFAKSESIRLFKTHFRRLGSQSLHTYIVLHNHASD